MQPQYTHTAQPDTKTTPRPWTPEEDFLLRALYFTCTRFEIADLLGRTHPSVRKRCSVLGLNQKHPALTDTQLDTIRKWYTERADWLAGDFDLLALASLVGMTPQNVSREARKMGLSRLGRQRNDETKKAQSARTKRYIAENGHPRGMLGKHHTEEMKARHSEILRARVVTPEQVEARVEKMMATRIARYGSGNPHWANRTDNAYSRTRSGKREDLGGKFFRSSWEANYARYLNWLIQHGEIQSWEFECKTFLFEGQTRGVISYTPDFRVVTANGEVEWHEVKGWMDDKSKARLKKMAKFFPDEKLVLIDSKVYRGIERSVSRIIPNWEGSR